MIGGIVFTKGPLAYLLKNRMYLGEINHGQSSYPGEHAAIVRAIFDKHRRPSPATQRPRAIPISGHRRCSSAGSMTTAAIE
jgi:hypothetical protein